MALKLSDNTRYGAEIIHNVPNYNSNLDHFKFTDSCYNIFNIRKSNLYIFKEISVKRKEQTMKETPEENSVEQPIPAISNSVEMSEDELDQVSGGIQKPENNGFNPKEYSIDKAKKLTEVMISS